MLIVKKFGGTSVGTVERINNVAKRCIEDYTKGNQIVVIVSAMGKTTDELINLAKKVDEEPSRREMDMLLSTGEQISASMLALAIQKQKIPAISLNAFQIKMETTSNHSDARLKLIDTQRINNELNKNKIVVITGFQGIDDKNDVTTLGRGGSDTTAVAIAATLHADKCEIYTDVDGVYTADPRKVNTARKLEKITYDEMLEFASLGAGVLHNRSVEMAKKFDVKLEVLSSLIKTSGTIVEGGKKMEDMLVSGVTADENFVNIRVSGIKQTKDATYSLFNILAKHNISVDIILQNITENNEIEISFTVNQDMKNETIRIIKENFKDYTEIITQENMAKVSIVGAGMKTNAGIAAKMFEALWEEGIEIKMISTSEIRISVLIDKQYMNQAINAIHKKFDL